MLLWMIFEEFDSATLDNIRRQLSLISYRILDWTGPGNEIGNKETTAMIRKLNLKLQEEVQYFVGQCRDVDRGRSELKDLALEEKRRASFDSFVEALNTLKKIIDIVEENEKE